MSTVVMCAALTKSHSLAMLALFDFVVAQIGGNMGKDTAISKSGLFMTMICKG
jgi:hypothetical protein